MITFLCCVLHTEIRRSHLLNCELPGQYFWHAVQVEAFNRDGLIQYT